MFDDSFLFIITSLSYIEESSEMFHFWKYQNCSESSIKIVHNFHFCWYIYQQTLHSSYHIHNNFFQQLMQNVNHHALIYVDQVIISCKIFHQMHSIIITWMNFILLLKFKLSNNTFMSSEFSNSSSEILTLSWNNSTYYTLLIAFDFCDHSLFFIVNHKVCNDRKTFSNIIISTDELNFILWIFFYN